MKLFSLLIVAIISPLALARPYVMIEGGTYSFKTDATSITSSTNFNASKMKNSFLPFSYALGAGVEIFSESWISFCVEGIYSSSFRNENNSPSTDNGANTYVTSSQLRTHAWEGRGDVGINFKVGDLRVRPLFGIGVGSIHSTMDMNHSITSNSPQDNYYVGLDDRASLKRAFIGVGFFDEKLKLASKITVGQQSLSNRRMSAVAEHVNSSTGVRTSYSTDGTYSFKLDSLYLNLSFIVLF